MLFHSIEFGVFFLAFFIFYWWISSHKIQNVAILIASYIFYAFWDWRFLALIIISSATDFFAGILIYHAKNSRIKKGFLLLSLVINLGLLGFFKYYNFFIESFINLFSLISIDLNWSTLNLILPLGISFYTFQTISYTIDIYRGEFVPTKNPFEFFAFVSFFPQLIAGPIERAKGLLPQFQRERVFDYQQSRDGLKQILYGLFKKLLIADTLGAEVDFVFTNYSDFSSPKLILTSIYFVGQIYCDFSAYSDIAIGLGKTLGFKLTKNFDYPLYSTDFSQLWRKWHITLMDWFRDYIYIPLGGNKVSKTRWYFNVLIVFALSGIWHGADVTFIIWGLLNGILVFPFFRSNHKFEESPVISTLQMVLVTVVFGFLLILFRSPTLMDALGYYQNIATNFNISYSDVGGWALIALVFLLSFEWINRKTSIPLRFNNLKLPFKWALYMIICLLIILMSTKEQEPFIYFQF
ncbi:MAG: MBOAT family O-acyltransferase [Cyclobacteriaceae bacterium]